EKFVRFFLESGETALAAEANHLSFEGERVCRIHRLVRQRAFAVHRLGRRRAENDRGVFPIDVQSGQDGEKCRY
ncbi:MAG: hypothetical protein QF437_08335, partial [Planctomycetota bacterium]|nr:hypothetical protein [Planctomycetota bacterium]